MESTRQRKVASDIEKVVAQYLNTNVATLFPAVIISVIRSQISADLKNVNIYVSIYDLSGKNEGEKIFYTVCGKASQIRKEVAEKCNLRFTPYLNFIHDTGYEAEDRINKKLIELKKSGK